MKRELMRDEEMHLKSDKPCGVKKKTRLSVQLLIYNIDNTAGKIKKKVDENIN